MRKAILFVAAATLMSLVSCSDQKKYQDFADTFAEAVSKSDTAVVKQMIKGGEKLCFADIEMAPITGGSLQMEALQSEGYKMTWGDKIAIIKPAADDKLEAVEVYKVFTCTDNARLDAAKQLNLIKSEENIAMIEAVCSDEVTQELSKKKAEAISLNNIPETFYKKSFKAIPILPSFTKSFGDVMRRTQAEAGYNGIKGYICYCFWQYWVGASDSYIESYTTSDFTTESIDDTHASVSVHLTFKVATPDGRSSMSFNDKFMLVKTGESWKIDDIIRDGNSLHTFFKTNRPYIP